MSLSLNVSFNSSYELDIDDNWIRTKGNVVLDDEQGNKSVNRIPVVLNANEFDSERIVKIIQNNETKLCTGDVDYQGNQYIFNVSKMSEKDKSSIKDIEVNNGTLQYYNDKNELADGLIKAKILIENNPLRVVINRSLFNNGAFDNDNKLKEYLLNHNDNFVSFKYKLVSQSGRAVVILLSVGQSEDQVQAQEQETSNTVMTAKKTVSENENNIKREDNNEVTTSKSEIDTLKEELAKKNKEIEELKQKLNDNAGLIENNSTINDILAIANSNSDDLNKLLNQLETLAFAFVKVKPVLEDLQERNEIEKERKNVEDLDAIEQYYFNLSPEAILSDKVDRLLDDKRDHSVPYQRIVDEAIARRKTIFDKPDDENKPKVVKKTDRVVIERNDVE